MKTKKRFGWEGIVQLAILVFIAVVIIYMVLTGVK